MVSQHLLARSPNIKSVYGEGVIPSSSPAIYLSSVQFNFASRFLATLKLITVDMEYLGTSLPKRPG